MSAQTVCWEDDENNRRVTLEVEYDYSNGELDIQSVTPSAISFLDATSREEVRSIKVWTEAGRRLVVRQYVAWGGMNHLNAVLGNELVAAE